MRTYIAFEHAVTPNMDEWKHVEVIIMYPKTPGVHASIGVCMQAMEHVRVCGGHYYLACCVAGQYLKVRLY